MTMLHSYVLMYTCMYEYIHVCIGCNGIAFCQINAVVINLTVLCITINTFNIINFYTNNLNNVLSDQHLCNSNVSWYI